MMPQEDEILRKWEIFPPNERSDMNLSKYMKVVLEQFSRSTVQNIVDQVPFWYDHPNAFSSSAVFWSENHYIMSTSDDLLLRQKLGESVESLQPVYQRIHAFLDVRLQVGISEFLSPVYLPMTILALLNLIDFARNDPLNMLQKCALLLDKVAVSVISVVNIPLSSGKIIEGTIAAPSGRSYERHRTSSLDKNDRLYQFAIFCLIRSQLPPVDPQQEDTFLRRLHATRYRCSVQDLIKFLPRSNTVKNLTLTESEEFLITTLDKVAPVTRDMSVHVSLLWSYGVWIPDHWKSLTPFFAKMQDHPHFRAVIAVRRNVENVLYYGGWVLSGLAFLVSVLCLVFLKGKLPRIIIAVIIVLGCVLFYCCQDSFVVTLTLAHWLGKLWLKGLRLTGANLKSYRQAETVCSWLEDYNAGYFCFQQNPLCVNMNGSPIWSSFGGLTTTSSYPLASIVELGSQEKNHEISTSLLFPTIRFDEQEKELSIQYNIKSGTFLSFFFQVFFSLYFQEDAVLYLPPDQEIQTITDQSAHQWQVIKGQPYLAFFVSTYLVKLRLLDRPEF